jgi:hypothetical protein
MKSNAIPRGWVAAMLLAWLATTSRSGLCAADLILSEYLAANIDGLEDEDGDRPDWIEIQNLGADAVDLDGWYLTDDSGALAKWRFPSRTLGIGEALVVFASGKNRATADGELHTNFSLSADGEYLALVSPGGVVVDHYPPPFLPQENDVSYGVSQTVTDNLLVRENAVAAIQVPVNGAMGLDWTSPAFDDASWTRGSAPVGFDRDGGDIVPPGGERNLALAGTATQSSTGFGGSASRAIDGNTDPTYGDGSITHTNGEAGGWWEVDLGDSFFLRRIVLWNRVDCCSNRLTNFRLSVLDASRNEVAASDHFTDRTFPTGQSYEVRLPDATRGRFVRIAKLGPDQNGEYWLSLAEVQVFEGLTGFQSLLGTNIESSMFGTSASVYLRFTFQLDAAGLAALQILTLRAKYDDGFVAYLNGTKVAARNAPDAPVWSSTATAERGDSEAVSFEEINVSSARSVLRVGANVLALQVLNLAPGDGDLLFAAELVARRVAGSGRLYFQRPTPGAINDTPGVEGFVSETELSHDHGFFDAPFQLAMGTSTAGAVIRYTLDGSAPTSTHGTVYSGPIRISGTTTLRAEAFKVGLVSAKVHTATYVFLDDVIASPVMNASITKDPRYAPEMRNALTDLPTISLVTPATISDTTEVPVSMELILADGTPGFQIDAGVVYYGGAFTSFAKKNFRLHFRGEYGATKLKYPLFRGHDRTILSVDTFDQLELRGGSHDMVERGFYMSNLFTDDTMLDMGNLNPHGRFVHVYLNGTYWGQYHLRERWNASMLAEYLGGKKEDYEAINGNWNVGGWPDPGVPYDGDGSAWTRIKSLRDDYQAVKAYLDVQSYVDYMLMFLFGDSEDEYRCVGPTAAGTGFKFLLNDADGFTRDGGNRTAMGQPGRQSGDGPGSIFSMLLAEADPEYMTLLGDRIHKHFFDDGAMTPAKNTARLLERCSQVARAFYAESARWGYRTPSSWESAKNAYVSGVLPGHTAAVVSQFRAAGFYPHVEAPSFNKHGGIVAAGFTVTMTAARGAVYFTADGTDPRLQGGAVSPLAHPTSNPAGANALQRNTTVKARSLSGGEWSALSEATFLVEAGNLRVTELMYHPPRDPATDTFDREEYEFLELQNVGARPYHLLGVRFTEGIHFDFSPTTDPGADLAPGATVLIVKNRQAFESRYGASGFLIAGEYAGNLDNAGERIVLSDVFGNTLLDFTYSEAWYPKTDGDGPSLEIIDSRSEPATWNLKQSWRAGAYLGTPGFHPFGDPSDGGLQLSGDLNQDASVDLADVVSFLFHLFAGARALPCGSTLEDAGNRDLLDVDSSGAVSITDAVFLLNYLFRAGPPPALGGRCVRIRGCPEACGG